MPPLCAPSARRFEHKRIVAITLSLRAIGATHGYREQALLIMLQPQKSVRVTHNHIHQTTPLVGAYFPRRRFF